MVHLLALDARVHGSILDVDVDDRVAVASDDQLVEPLVAGLLVAEALAREVVEGPVVVVMRGPPQQLRQNALLGPEVSAGAVDTDHWVAVDRHGNCRAASWALRARKRHGIGHEGLLLLRRRGQGQRRRKEREHWQERRGSCLLCRPDFTGRDSAVFVSRRAIASTFLFSRYTGMCADRAQFSLQPDVEHRFAASLRQQTEASSRVAFLETTETRKKRGSVSFVYQAV